MIRRSSPPHERPPARDTASLDPAAGNATWTSTLPNLSGNFAPVVREIDAVDLPVIAGRIPPALRGAYVRNGPNPQFAPISFTFPLDGDGMVHAIYLEQGRATYRNRFVATSSLALERRVGRAVYGGFAAPLPVDPQLLQPGDNPGPFKNGAFIHVIAHAGRLLALNEATTSYEMTWDLETVGQWSAGTSTPLRLGAHNRRHPRTGTLFALAYSWRSSEVLLHQIDPGGTLRSTTTLALPAPTMIHDFILTEHYLVVAAGPAIFDLAAARAGESMLQWRPEQGMRIAVIPLDGGPTTWIETDAFFVFHFANGFERGQQIVIDYVHYDSLNLSAADDPPGSLRRMTLDLPSRSLQMAVLCTQGVEFPRIHERHEALPYRHAYLSTLTPRLQQPHTAAATFNAVLKVDTDTGAVRCHDFGDHLTGEAVFVPRPGGHAEDDGYLALFRYDPSTQTSDFVLLDATCIDAEPVAVVRLPQRVPQGLHGSWIPRP